MNTKFNLCLRLSLLYFELEKSVSKPLTEIEKIILKINLTKLDIKECFKDYEKIEAKAYSMFKRFIVLTPIEDKL